MLKVNELFSGIGAQAKALERLGIEHEIVATADIDKDAIVSYAAIHNSLTLEMVESYTKYPLREEMADYLLKLNIGYDFKKDVPFDWFKLARRKTTIKNVMPKIINTIKYGKPTQRPIEMYYLATIISKQVGDISIIDKLPKADLWTYSFPCTDISVAGQQKGLSKDSGTRSGLLWEVERLLNIAKANDELPNYLLMENVKNLVGKKFKADFYKWLQFLDDLGYKTYWQVLNAKDYGIPQNRERVFAVSFLDKREFQFPETIPLELRLKDVLECNVDEKYYLSDTLIEGFIKHTENHKKKGTGFLFKPKQDTDVANCLVVHNGFAATDNTIEVKNE